MTLCFGHAFSMRSNRSNLRLIWLIFRPDRRFARPIACVIVVLTCAVTLFRRCNSARPGVSCPSAARNGGAVTCRSACSEMF